MVERINAAMRTIHTTTGLRPAPHVAARITRFARHDPAAVRGIASVLSREQVLGDAVLPDPLPAPRAIRKAVEGIVADLDPASLRLLTVAAHMVSDRTDVLLAAAAVDIAVVLSDRSTGALAFFDGRFRFRDDRLRAVLLQEEDAAHRKEVHRSLSRASALLPEPRIASWHALQSEAPNAPSPAALLPLAERLLRSGDLHGAFTVAAEVAGRSSDHARAEAALIAGRAAFALGCLDDATRLLSRRRATGPGRRRCSTTSPVYEISHTDARRIRPIRARPPGPSPPRPQGSRTRGPWTRSPERPSSGRGTPRRPTRSRGASSCPRSMHGRRAHGGSPPAPSLLSSRHTHALGTSRHRSATATTTQRRDPCATRWDASR